MAMGSSIAQRLIVRLASQVRPSPSLSGGAAVVQVPQLLVSPLQVGGRETRIFSSSAVKANAKNRKRPVGQGAQLQVQLERETSGTKSRGRKVNSKKILNKSINEKLLQLGKEQRNWNAFLTEYEQNQDEYDAINYATLLRQLLMASKAAGYSHDTNNNDPRVASLVQNLWQRIDTLGLTWWKCRGAASMLYALAKLRLHHHENPHARECTHKIFQYLGGQPDMAAQFMAQASAFDIANVAYACAVIDYPAPHLFQRIDRQATRWIGSGNQTTTTNNSENNNNNSMANAQDISNTLWAFATLGHDPPHNILQIVEQRAQQLIQTGSSQAIVNTAWSCATLRVPMPRYFQALDQNVETALQGATPQAVANAVWSCATLGHDGTQLFHALNRDADWFVRNGSHQAVSMAAWSCAVLGHAAPQLWNAMERNATWLIQQAKASQAVANILWASCTLFLQHNDRHINNIDPTASPKESSHENQPTSRGHIPTRLLYEVEQRATWLVETGNAQEIANVMAAFATLDCAAPQLVRALLHQSDRLVAQASPQELANLAWSLAVLDVYDGDTIAANDDNKSQIDQDANGADAGIATLTSSSQFFGALERNLHVLLEDKTPQHLTKTCYAIAVLGLVHEQHECLVQLWERALQLLDETIIPDADPPLSTATTTDSATSATLFGNECLHQLFQTYLFAKTQGIDLPVTPRFITQCRQTMQSSHIVSDLSTEVSQWLTEIGFVHDCEVVPDDTVLLPAGAANMLAIDFANRESKVAVELDGPSHFLKHLMGSQSEDDWQHCGDWTENGATRAKRRYLQQLGWTVINLNFRDYKQAKREDRVKDWLGEKVLQAIQQP